MYRSRMGDNLGNVTLDYVSSISSDMEIAHYDILGSQAHVIMLFEQKMLTKTDVKKILLSLEKLKRKNLPTTSGAEDIHELIEYLVIKDIGKSSGGKMHTARSRNDQVSLDMRLKLRDDVNILSNCILETISVLLTLAKLHQKTVVPLYTHLQQAQVGVFSHYLLSYCDSLFRDLDRFHSLYDRINLNPLGAGPVGGTGLSINRQSTTKILGFADMIENSLDATTTRDFVIEYVSAVSIMMTNLSRIAEDLILWSTSEFSFIELSDEFTSPSSVMPQKKNPDILELTRGKTAQVIGYLTSMLTTVKALPSGYSRDLQQIKPSLWSTSKISISALIIIKSMFATLTVNKSKMKKSSHSDYLTALDLAEKLVQNNIPFRVSHQIIGNIVMYAHNEKKPISKIPHYEIKKIVAGTGVNPQTLKNILKSTTIQSSINDRISIGSPGTKEQSRMIISRNGLQKSHQKIVTKRENEIKIALRNLNKKIKILTN